MSVWASRTFHPHPKQHDNEAPAVRSRPEASQTVVQHQGVLCAFRAPVKTPLSEADWMAEVAVSPLALEVLSSGDEITACWGELEVKGMVGKYAIL